MKAVVEKIEQIITPALESMNYALVRTCLINHGGQQTLQVMAERESDGHLGIDDCEKISKTLSALLDVEDPIEAAYTLEVSSPGIDRPLTRLKDFERFVGFDARVEMDAPIEKQKRFKGRILGLKEECVSLQTDKGEQNLPFAAIQNAKLILTDELIAATENTNVNSNENEEV